MNRRKLKNQRKELLVQIRMTVDQKKVITEAATEAGLNVSSWLRALAVQAAKRRS